MRAYAVHCLEELPDDELALYMLQLCQQLKFERYSAHIFFLLQIRILIVDICLVHFNVYYVSRNSLIHVHIHSHVDSALSRFLLRRALTKPRLIGHIYYWLLQSEVYNADVTKRYVILLQVRCVRGGDGDYDDVLCFTIILFILQKFFLSAFVFEIHFILYFET